MAESANNVALQQIIPDANEKGVVEYNVGGNPVKLSYTIVRNYLAKGETSKITDADLVQFIQICKFNQLNPFLNEAYLVKYGANAQMVVSKEALFKRAECNEQYDGIQAGVIVQTKEGEIKDVEGCFFSPNETLVGGWAKVFRKDRKFPIVARVRLEEYDTKQSLWKGKASTMISKVAKVQAMREAFPVQLGAMYTIEEQGIEDAHFVEIKEEIANNANKTQVQVNIPEPSHDESQAQAAAQSGMPKMDFGE